MWSQKKKSIPEKKREEIPQNFVSQLFNFFIIFTNGMFKLLNNIITGQPGVIWGTLFILTILVLKGQAAEIPEGITTSQTAVEQFLNTSSPSYRAFGNDTSEANTFYEVEEGVFDGFNDDKNNSIEFFPTKSLEAYSFISHLDSIQQKEVSGIDAACDGIKAQKKLCLKHRPSCPHNQKSISNYEKTIKIRSETLSLLKTMCEPFLSITPASIITKCHGDVNWILGKDKTDNSINLSPHYAKFTRLFHQDAINSVHRAINSQHMIKNQLSHSEVFLPSSYEKFHSVMDQIMATSYNNFSISEKEKLSTLSTKHTRIPSISRVPTQTVKIC